MAADPPRGAGGDDVGPVLDGAAEEAAGAERVVDDERHAVVVRDVGNPLEVGDVEAGVADRFEVDRLRVLVDQALDGVRVVAVGDVHVEPAAGEGVFKLVVGAAVEVARRDDVVAVLAERVEGEELGRLPAGRRDGHDAAFEGRHPLLEHVVRRIHDAGVDVAELLEGKEVGPVLRIVEGVGRGGVDGHGPRASGWVRLLPRVQLKGFVAGLVRVVGGAVVGAHKNSLDGSEDKSPSRRAVGGLKKKRPSRRGGRGGWGTTTNRSKSHSSSPDAAYVHRGRKGHHFPNVLLRRLPGLQRACSLHPSG